MHRNSKVIKRLEIICDSNEHFQLYQQLCLETNCGLLSEAHD